MTVGVSVKSLGDMPDPEALLELAHKNMPRRSLAERTEQILEDLEDLSGAYRQVADSETKIGRALSASRRERLQQVHSLISDILGETAPRDEEADEPDTPPAGMDEGAHGAGAPDDPAAGLQLSAQALRLRTRAALVQAGVSV
jgi:hypothetical protein